MPAALLISLFLLSASGTSWGAQEQLTQFRLQTCATNSACFDIHSPMARRGYLGSFYTLDGPLTVDAHLADAKLERFCADDAFYSIASGTLMLRSAHEDVLIELQSGKINRFPHR